MKIKMWTEALRSEKYSQGIGMLYDSEENTFCCLGVACDIVNPRFKKRDPKMLDCANFVVPMNGEVKELKEKYPLIESYLATMNDFEVSFEKIADEINRLWAGDDKNYKFYNSGDGIDHIEKMIEAVKS